MGTSKVSITSVRAGHLAPILVVEFATFNADDTISTALGADAYGHSVYRLDPVSDLLSSADVPTLDWLACGYADVLDRERLAPALVIGYCSAANLAMRVAREVGRRHGREIEMLLIEPTWVTDERMIEAVQSVCESLGSPDAVVAADIINLAAILARLSVDLMARLASDGIDDDEQEMMLPILLDRYRAWFGFLTEVRRTEIPLPAGPTTVAVSADGGRTPASTWPPQAARTERLGIGTTELMSSPEVRMLIRDIAARAATAVDE